MNFEVPLSGGDVSEGVVRVGETVRRPLRAHSPAVHGLLRHLEAVGFDGAPRVLGIDEVGREVLSWVPGDVPDRPIETQYVSEDVLRGVGRLLRRYHEAVASYEAPNGAPWDGETSNLDGEPEVIGHCDVTPENVVFRGGVPCALIDFDLARPTTRLFDVVTALRHWGPIADPADRDAVLYGADVGRRLRVFCDAYGLDRESRRDVLPAARVRFERSYRAMREKAQGGGGWGRIWQGGAGARIRRAQDWLERHWDELDARLW
ncbi:phosphotransferase enzyme family protein [Actinomadura madurae]|uniref:phosphotransferase enzyme family protein n=1 Tax=Actinomadura madurae TaxID=1993 RepID=UPI0020D2449D|nr:aminoglycoside phosphotransferase family protein [Actinomadura madurae]MCP9949718.1 aminoglycoside phosphotransferase family protein [Actinomadura madurae]MCP9966467.1 aminoglycoside phosphotransferase family protein [Actinomadura madurae]MCQ0009520.1 aminoglycoside phosphotransferase family protein [Actinomadura madurae]MCQ0015139.1 aminoglycoside phosphotransferase family protein [Actinomadura madurae]